MLFQILTWIRGHINSVHEYVTQLRKFKFEILTGIAVLVIMYAVLTSKNENGSWSTTYSYIPPIHNKPLYYSSTTVAAPMPTKESSGETRARRFLESYFNDTFPKSRPGFMVNHVTGSKYNLELDCYNEKHRLAVEYNGAQHYNFTPFFHRNKEAFYNQKYRDELKRIRCKELGITFIEIPYTEEDRLEEYLEEQLQTHGFEKHTVNHL